MIFLAEGYGCSVFTLVDVHLMVNHPEEIIPLRRGTEPGYAWDNRMTLFEGEVNA
ncbi:MAG: hypothetical protein ACLR17_03000 [Enterobacteriaceae bacterium]|nr:hypothetical protein [Klebsiella michiganensis]